MPSTRRRALVAIAAAGGVAGCTNLLSSNADDTSPADRRVASTFEPDAGEWLHSTRSFANDVVSPTARPPREEPSERWGVRDRGSVLGIAVADGVVFAGGRDGIEARGLEDGDLRWDDDEEANFTTVVAGRCYTANAERLVARDAETGDEVWRHELDEYGRLRSVLEADGTVYYTADGDLHGLHGDTGDRRWTVEGDGGEGRLAVTEGELHWATPDAYRILAPNGPERPTERTTISADTDPYTRPSSPAVVGGTIALGGWSDRPGLAPVRSLSRRGTVWQQPFEPMVQTPAILEDRLLVTGYDNGSDALDESTVAAFDPETGDTLWKTTVPEPVGSPAVADGVIYAGGGHPSEPASETGHLFALEVETGDVRWEIDTDDAFAGHPLALVDDAVVVGTQTGVAVFE